MPSEEAIAACVAAGLDPAQPFSFTRWIPDTHPELEIDYIAQGDVTVAVRLNNKSISRKIAKFSDPTSQPDNGTIDDTVTEVSRLQNLKNRKFYKDLVDQYPTVDFSVLKYSVAGGKLIVDVSGLTANQQTAAKTKLAASNYADQVVIVP